MRLPAACLSILLSVQSGGSAFAQSAASAARSATAGTPIGVVIPVSMQQAQPTLPQAALTTPSLMPPASLPIGLAPSFYPTAALPTATAGVRTVWRAEAKGVAQARPAERAAVTPVAAQVSLPVSRPVEAVDERSLNGAAPRIQRRLADAAALGVAGTADEAGFPALVLRVLAPSSLIPPRGPLARAAEPAHSFLAFRTLKSADSRRDSPPEEKETKEKLRASALRKVVAVGLSFAVIEAVGAWFTGSLALRADAMHLTLDTLISAGALLALWLARRAQDPSKPFRFAKAEPIMGLLSSIAIGFTGLEIGWESIGRLMDPVAVPGLLTIALAVSGLAANVINTLILLRYRDDSLSLKSAFLHALTDAIGSIGIIISGLLVYFFQWAWVDGAIGAIIVALILHTAWTLGRASWKTLRGNSPSSAS